MGKQIFNFGMQLAIFALIFWFSETMLFIFIDGWHLKATNHIEITCDDMVSFLLNISGMLVLYGTIFKINKLYNDK